MWREARWVRCVGGYYGGKHTPCPVKLWKVIREGIGWLNLCK